MLFKISSHASMVFVPKEQIEKVDIINLSKHLNKP